LVAPAEQVALIAVCRSEGRSGGERLNDEVRMTNDESRGEMGILIADWLEGRPGDGASAADGTDRISRHALASGPWLIRAGRVGGSDRGLAPGG
jgi:hypothetical protein